MDRARQGDVRPASCSGTSGATSEASSSCFLASAARASRFSTAPTTRRRIPYGSAFWRVPQWWTLPRAHTRGTYFKRELTTTTAQRRYFFPSPNGSSGRTAVREGAPSDRVLHPRGEDRRRAAGEGEAVQRACRGSGGRGADRGRRRPIVFEREADYYARPPGVPLRRSRRSARAGTASGTTRSPRTAACRASGDLDRKPPRCAPHGLEPGSNCLSYRDADDLMRQVDALGDERLRPAAIGRDRTGPARTRLARALPSFLAKLGLGTRLACARPGDRGRHELPVDVVVVTWNSREIVAPLPGQHRSRPVGRVRRCRRQRIGRRDARGGPGAASRGRAGSARARRAGLQRGLQPRRRARLCRARALPERRRPRGRASRCDALVAALDRATRPRSRPRAGSSTPTTDARRPSTCRSRFPTLGVARRRRSRVAGGPPTVG